MELKLHGDAKEAQLSREGRYSLQTDPVNEKPCWFQETGGNAIWYAVKQWKIGLKKDLGKDMSGILSPDDVEHPLQALTWKYYRGGWHESKNIDVSKFGNIYVDLIFKLCGQTNFGLLSVTKYQSFASFKSQKEEKKETLNALKTIFQSCFFNSTKIRSNNTFLKPKKR